MDACAETDNHSSLFGTSINPEWGSMCVDSQWLAQSWCDAQSLTGAERALNDYVTKASATTAGCFGWFLNDEHRHTRYDSQWAYSKRT